MAHSATASTSIDVTRPFRAVFSAVAWFFDGLIEAQIKADKYQHLQSLSDKALAQRGLTREDIVHHVFADK